jgi:hypothetical protein
MIVETIYQGRDNTFSLRLTRASVAENLSAVDKYEFVIDGLRTITDQSLFVEKQDGVVELNIGTTFAPTEVGSYKCHLVTFDPINRDGVRWPDMKLKVKT